MQFIGFFVQNGGDVLTHRKTGTGVIGAVDGSVPSFKSLLSRVFPP